MLNPCFEHLRNVLWPAAAGERTGRVYALVDAAQDPNIYPLLRESLIHYQCLFAGSLPWELARVAPYLVLLNREAPFTETLIDRGWGKNWAVYLTSSAMPDDLHRHFRRFLR